MCRHSQHAMPSQQSVATGGHSRSILAREINDAQRRVDYFGRRIELNVVPRSRHERCSPRLDHLACSACNPA